MACPYFDLANLLHSIKTNDIHPSWVHLSTTRHHLLTIRPRDIQLNSTKYLNHRVAHPSCPSLAIRRQFP